MPSVMGQYDLARIAARAGVGIAGAMRAGAAPDVSWDIDPDDGHILWHRDQSTDGDPIGQGTWTTVRS